jgi:hypothetical protein
MNDFSLKRIIRVSPHVHLKYKCESGKGERRGRKEDVVERYCCATYFTFAIQQMRKRWKKLNFSIEKSWNNCSTPASILALAPPPCCCAHRNISPPRMERGREHQVHTFSFHHFLLFFSFFRLLSLLSLSPAFKVKKMKKRKIELSERREERHDTQSDT